MRSLRVLLFCGFGLAAAGFGWRWFVRGGDATWVAAEPAEVAPRPNVAAAGPDSPLRVATGDGRSAVAALRERLAYAQGWTGVQPPALAAFRAWTERYLATTDPVARATLAGEGVALAQARRPEMLALIKAEPERALALTVPAAVRAELPTAVLVELETRVAGKGDYERVVACEPQGAVRLDRPGEWRRAVIGETAYLAHVYGRREPQLTKMGASLHGIAIGRDLALHASPVRLLEVGELPAGVVEDARAIFGTAVVANSGVVDRPAVEGTWAAAFGRTWSLAGREADGFAAMEAVLVAAEDRVGWDVPAPGAPSTAAEATNSRTVGLQKVLVIRVDFSDFPGTAATVNEIQSTMDGSVRPFLENASYGLTTVSTTVSGTLYRLPQTGSAYAIADNDTQLHTDARNLAAADFTLADYQRIVVLFPNIGTSRVTGSQFTFAGQAIRGGANVWLNGTFAWQTVAHELGHTYGLSHANLWRVTDANPLSPAGTTLEYGDPFDIMGGTGVTRDQRHHFNARFKNRLGWLPDTAVATATTSGTYRIYRFDHVDALGFKQPLALRVYRDGVRTYWISYRQNFSTGAVQTQGAYVMWNFNDYQQSQLLDLTTPGVSANDAVLAVGETFTDPIYGITIKPVAKGGADPALYLDVEVVMPAAPPGVVTAWGREGSPFYSVNTGELVSPAPETAVPQNLTGIRQIAAGDAHAIALNPDGSVAAWGNNTSGQTTIPAGLGTSVVGVAAAGNISGVVKLDGTVQLWGAALGGVTTPPAGLTGVKQLVIGGSQSVGIYHALALKTDGSVVGWGDNSRGQATPPAGLGVVTAVAANDRGSIALKADGTVVRWGTDFTGALPLPTGLTGVTAIAAHGGAAHALALKADGTVVAWGINSNSQATPPTGLNEVVAVAAGQFHSLALKVDGSVVAWGSTTSGKINVPVGLPRSRAIAASAQASFAISGPHLYFTGQPKAQVAALGGSVRLYVEALGAGALSYQWRKNGVPIAGATAATLTLNGLTAADASGYDVVVNDAGSGRTLTSTAAALTLVPAGNPGRLVNLSILTSINAASPQFTVGTVIGGAGTSGTKPLLVRAAGPALTTLGVGGVLSDPKLSLFSDQNTQTPVATNDNWGGSAALSTAFASVGAFPYGGATSLDAATFSETMPAGGYTVQVSGVGGATGTVIAELYDATRAADFTASTPRLVNVSVLKQIDAGEILTVGFVIGGTTAKQVLVRAIGPTLAAAPFNVGGAMADPKVSLFSGQTVINANDNWGGGSLLSATGSAVGAFAIGNTASRDASLLATLAPGSYTVQVSGANSASGLTLVEVYEVP